MPHEMTAEEKAQFNAQVREQQIKNKKELDETMARNYGVQTPVQTVESVESRYKFPQQILAEKKKRGIKQHLREQ